MRLAYFLSDNVNNIHVIGNLLSYYTNEICSTAVCIHPRCNSSNMKNILQKCVDSSYALQSHSLLQKVNHLKHYTTQCVTKTEDEIMVRTD